MASETGTTVNLEVVIGEDFSCQIFWTDEYNEPVPVTDPILADVKDAHGQIALRFSTTADPETQPRVNASGYAGFFQLTAPRAVTATLLPGRYAFDLFAAVADSAAPFSRQVRQVVSGWVTALPRVTHLEDATEVVISADEEITV